MVEFDAVSDMQVSLTAISEDELLKAEALINSVISEKIIHVHKSNPQSLESKRWKELCSSIRFDYKGKLILAIDDTNRAIHVAGRKLEIPKVVETIERFLTSQHFDKKKGDATTGEWTEAEKKLLTETSAMRVLYVGESEAGKSSLVGTILSGDSYLAEDRTVVAELDHWVVKDQNKTFTLVDLGGHTSYASSGHFFHCNSSNNIATLVHDITVEKFDKTFKWLKSVLTRSPNCHIAIALTKSDLLNEKEQEAKLKLFREKLTMHLQKEIDILKDSIYFAKKKDFSESQLLRFNDLRQKYELIIEQMEAITVLVSCKKKESVGALTDIYVQLSEKPENKVELPVHYNRVFSRSGNVGMRIVDVETMPNEIITADSRIDDIDAFQKEISVNDDQTKSELPLNTNTSQPQIPILPEKKTEQKVSQYMTLDEAIAVYNEALEYHELPPAVDEKADTQKCFDFLHKHGLMMYFLVEGPLGDIVFNNINTFVKIMCRVFHHDLRQSLENFRTIPVQSRDEFYENDETRYRADVELLKSQGLLSLSLLKIFLHKSGCQIDPEAILQLLELLEIGFSYVPEGMDKKYVFIPYFVHTKELGAELEEKIAELKKSDTETLSVHCQTLWHYLVVRFCKELHPNEMQKKEIWSDGFFAYVGNSDVRLHLRYNGEDKIDLVVKGNVTTRTGHDIIWQYIKLLNSEISKLMEDWWPGLVTKRILFCTHCTILCQQERTEENCREKSLDQMLDSKNCYPEKCSCGHEQIPSALLMPLPPDATKGQARVTALCDYLKKTFAKSPENTELAEGGNSLTQMEQPLSQEMLMQQGRAVVNLIAGEMQQNSDRLAKQLCHQGKVLSDQMFHQGKELQHNITLHAGDADAANITYRYPGLNKNKDCLEAHLNANGDLLSKLVSYSVISGDDKKKVEAQTGQGGKQKLLLYYIDNSVMDEEPLFQCFIDALEECEGAAMFCWHAS